MKLNLLSLIPILLLVGCNSPKDKPATIPVQSKQDSIGKNAIDSLFVWEVETLPKGKMMYLDVPYSVDGKTEYLSLTVAKEATNERPTFISVIVPNDLDESVIMEMTFKDKEDSRSQTVYPDFDKCKEDYCTFRINNGYAVDKAKKEVDVFRNFLRYDVVYFSFVRKNGAKYSVSVPLYSFKEQYK